MTLSNDNDQEFDGHDLAAIYNRAKNDYSPEAEWSGMSDGGYVLKSRYFAEKGLNALKEAGWQIWNIEAICLHDCPWGDNEDPSPEVCIFVKESGGDSPSRCPECGARLLENNGEKACFVCDEPKGESDHDSSKSVGEPQITTELPTAAILYLHGEYQEYPENVEEFFFRDPREEMQKPYWDKRSGQRNKEELVRKTDLPQQWKCTSCLETFYWEGENPGCPSCAATPNHVEKASAKEKTDEVDE